MGDSYKHQGVRCVKDYGDTSLIVNGSVERFRLGAHAWNYIDDALRNGFVVLDGVLVTR